MLPQKTINCLSLNVKYPAATHVHSAPRHSQKRELSPRWAGCYQSMSKLKYVKGANSNFESGLHPFFSDLAKTHKISHSCKLLCQSSQEQLPDGGITSAYRQKCSRACPQSNFSGIFQPTFSGPQTKQQMETHLRSEQTKPLSQGGEIQNGNAGNHQDIPPIRVVGHFNRFQGRLLPHSNTGTVQEIPQISCPRSDIPIQSTSLRSLHSTLGVYNSGQRGNTDGHTQGIRIHQYLDDWLVRARSHQVCLQHKQELVKICQNLGWLVNLEKSELEPKQIFNFVGYQFDLQSGRV